ncbi:hypothetical protein ACFQGT_08750 [Natrialbaceae archaeon GCM10025810]|uniref:hypothetical protein n=1 Tax=Halovalidus salilacus TaxID=3075124 RepID=UPI003612B76A
MLNGPTRRTLLKGIAVGAVPVGAYATSTGGSPGQREARSKSESTNERSRDSDANAAASDGSADDDGEGDPDADGDEPTDDSGGDSADDGEPDGDGQPSFDVEFVSCDRVEVTGTFSEGDTVAASTGFFTSDDPQSIGNTIIEDAITIGDDVEAPFSGTIVFEVGEESGVEGGSDGATVEIENYGATGTVITGISDPEGYVVAQVTHPNPNADACLEALLEDDSNSEQGTETETESGAPTATGTEPDEDTKTKMKGTERARTDGESVATDSNTDCGE